MASYKLLIKSSAAQELEALPRKDRSRIVAKIEGLAVNPRPAESEKLSGEEKYRLRQGDYRVLYSIEDAHERSYGRKDRPASGSFPALTMSNDGTLRRGLLLGSPGAAWLDRNASIIEVRPR